MLSVQNAQATTGLDHPEPLISNAREVTLSVENLEESVGFYTRYFGYEVVQRAELSDTAWRRLWRLPQGTKARVALLRLPGTEVGGFRILQFYPTSKVFIRMPYRTLDTALVGCDMPVRDVEGTFHAITGDGWGMVSEIFTFVPPQMTTPVTVGVVIGPSGERLPLLSSSELQNDPAYSEELKAAPFYIAFQITDDIERDTALYTGLGLSVVRDRTFEVPSLNRTVGVPEDAVWRSLQVSHPEETFGRVGLVQYLNHTGRNLSDRSDPPNLGMLMLSFRTRDMVETYRHLRESQVQVMCSPAPVANELYGGRQVMTVKQPSGVWLEFYA